MRPITWKMIFNEFKQKFPNLIKDLHSWRPYDHLKILIKQIDGTEIIYDYLTKKSYVTSPEPIEVDERKTFMDEESWREEFSNRLFDILDGIAMTQKELSELSGVDERMIRRYKHCDSTPSAYVVYKFANAIGCDVGELLDFD